MTGRERSVLDVLEQEGPELPVVVLARKTGLRPTELVEVLDGLHDEGHVIQGAEPQSVAVAPPQSSGRFIRAENKREAHA